jgi:hypothetical protein
MSNAQENKSAQLEKPEPQKITPETGELDAGKLDEVAGGNGGSSVHKIGGPPAPTP